MSNGNKDQFGNEIEDVGVIRIINIAAKLPVHDASTCKRRVKKKVLKEEIVKGVKKKVEKLEIVEERCPGKGKPVKPYTRRSEWAVRKIILHQHAGGVLPPTTKKRGGGVPEKIFETASFDIRWMRPDKPTEGRHWPGFSYHFDVPFIEELDGGKRVVYQTQPIGIWCNHTGKGVNATGIGISMIGTMRHRYSPEGNRSGYVEKTATMVEGKKVKKDYYNQGLPSKHQDEVVKELVRYLQNKYGIANCHVQGHFQHGKAGCPGVDFEDWAMELEDKPNEEGEGRFCYPVDVEGGDSAPFLNKEPAKEEQRCKKYILNTHEGGHGYYPFGRRFFWHNGVHLFPKPGKGGKIPVYAVRDGWIVACRLNGNVKVEGTDYGSSTFVLVQHEDPGLHDRQDKKNRTFYTLTDPRGKKTEPIARHPLYYSCYMHLEPLDENLSWMKEVKKRLEQTAYEAIKTRPTGVHTFFHLAIPVKTGEILGYVGRCSPFASRPEKVDDQAQKRDVLDKTKFLHFEMFSPVKASEQPNDLIQLFDSNAEISKKWKIQDLNNNDALADDATKKLKQLKGFKPFLADLEAAKEGTDKSDSPTQQDPTLWHVKITPKPVIDLSHVITQHVSEWGANWQVIIERYSDKWNVKTKKGKEHALNMIKGFQWWDEMVKDRKTHNNRSSEPWYKPLEQNDKPCYYHPIRFLNWLNGLKRDCQKSNDIERYRRFWKTTFSWETKLK